MPWSRQHSHVEVSDVCPAGQSVHTTQCIRAFIRETYTGVAESSSDQMYGGIVSWGLGCIVFPLCLGAFQIGVFKPLSLTTSHVVAPALGLCSVTASGIIASLTVLASYSNYDSVYENRDVEVSFSDVVCYGIGTAAVFKLMRGKFRSVLPSTILRPGAFASNGIPATRNYASTGKKARLAALGTRHGCHTCGKRWTAKSFIADHQPPLSLPKRLDVLHTLTKLFRPDRPDYRFFPQCPTCSSVQRDYLSAMATQRNTALAPRKSVRVDYDHIVTHATSLRLYHLFLPFPLLLAALFNTCG